MLDYFGDICLCKRCSIKLLSPTWKNKEYSTNEEVDKQAEKIISIACKYSYPEKLIEGLHGFFDSKRIEGLYCKLNGGCGQIITVCCDRIVINTNEDFDVKEIGKAYKRNLYKRRLRNIIRNNYDKFNQNYDYVLLIRKSCDTIDYREMEECFLNLIKKVK